MIRHGADYLQQAFERHGDVVRLPLLGPLRMVLVAHPDHIGHVLQANHKNYVVKRPSLHLTAMMGSGLTLSNGPLCRFAYLPFGAGPRFCIGERMAMLTLRMAIGMMVRRFRLRLVPGHPVVIHTAMTLQPKHGIRMTLEPRRGDGLAPRAAQ